MQNPAPHGPLPRMACTAALLLLGNALPGAELRAGESLVPRLMAAPPQATSLVRLDLLTSDAQIKQQLFEFTPRGTDVDTVVEFFNRRFHHREAVPLGARPARVSTYADPSLGENARRKKRLVVFLGYRHRGVETSTRTGLTAFYAFDEKDCLREIFITREEEHL